MMKIGDIIGDIVYLKFANPEFMKDIGIQKSDGHFYVSGKDELGLWLAHPGLEIKKILDEKGKPLPINKQKRELVDATFLVPWVNIVTIMHYPGREEYDFPYSETGQMGFSIDPEK